MARRMEQGESVALGICDRCGSANGDRGDGIDLSSALRSRLETAWVESVFDEFLIDEATQAVSEDLASRGYLQPTVKASIRNDGSVKTLDMVVEPGPRSTRTIRASRGCPSLWRMKSRPISTHVTWTSRRYRIQRPWRAKSKPTFAAVATCAQVATGMPLFAEATATLPVNVDSGPLFTIARVELEGTPEVPEEPLREALALDPEVPYDPDAVEAARNRLVAALRREGFATATVTVRANIDIEQPQVPVTFVIGPGPRQVLSDIVIVGNRAIDRTSSFAPSTCRLTNRSGPKKCCRRERACSKRVCSVESTSSGTGESTSTGDDVTPMRIRDGGRVARGPPAPWLRGCGRAPGG